MDSRGSGPRWRRGCNTGDERGDRPTGAPQRHAAPQRARASGAKVTRRTALVRLPRSASARGPRLVGPATSATSATGLSALSSPITRLSLRRRPRAALARMEPSALGLAPQPEVLKGVSALSSRRRRAASQKVLSWVRASARIGSSPAFSAAMMRQGHAAGRTGAHVVNDVEHGASPPREVRVLGRQNGARWARILLCGAAGDTRRHQRRRAREASLGGASG